MSKIAVFPGSFDPITKGHIDVIQRASSLFDHLYIAIGINSQKKILYPLEKRMAWITDLISPLYNVSVSKYEGLTAAYCKEIGANYLLRGIRNATDFDYEKTISQINNCLVPGLETVFLISRPELSHVSSTIVRELILAKADVSTLVPSEIISDLYN